MTAMVARDQPAGRTPALRKTDHAARNLLKSRGASNTLHLDVRYRPAESLARCFGPHPEATVSQDRWCSRSRRLDRRRQPSWDTVDGQMPGIDGPTVIRRIRLDAALRGLPCMMLT